LPVPPFWDRTAILTVIGPILRTPRPRGRVGPRAARAHGTPPWDSWEAYAPEPPWPGTANLSPARVGEVVLTRPVVA